MKLSKLYLALFIATSASMMTGCQRSMLQSVPLTVPSSLLQECPPLPLLADGRADTVLTWSVDSALMYNECARSKKAIIDFVAVPS